MKNFAIKYGIYFHLFGPIVFALLGAFSSWINKTYMFLYILMFMSKKFKYQSSKNLNYIL